ncbi:MAG: winged helix-turn-helix domain-containing protein [Vulcanisaeta sp. AZ3]
MNAVIKPEIVVTINGEIINSIPSYSNEYVLMNVRDFEAILDKTNLSIVLAIMRGSTHFAQIMRETGLQRGKLARHLRRLVGSGWIVRSGNGYALSGRIYVVYEVQGGDDSIGIKLLLNKGAFIDPVHGLIVINGEPIQNYCSACPLKQACISNVKSLARRYGVPLRGAEPSETYAELFSELVRRDLFRKLRGGWRIIISNGNSSS